MPSTNLINRYEPATGLILNGITINGNYLLVNNFTLMPTQEINMNNMYIQGGPGHAIGIIGKKMISGGFDFPLRVDENGTLEQPIKDILQCAEQVNAFLSIESENTISYPNVTADGVPTVNNIIIKFNPVKVQSLTITASSEGDSIKGTVKFIGMIDNYTDTIAPFSGTEQLGRALSWRDTDAYRISNQMRTLFNFEIEITQDVQSPVFLVPADTGTRTDFPGFLASKDMACKIKYEEAIRMGLNKFSFIHGGFMFGETIVFNYGPFTATIANPLFKTSSQPITNKLYKRTIEAYSVMKPSLPLSAGAVFNFN